jgi:hypothetical protein
MTQPRMTLEAGALHHGSRHTIAVSGTEIYFIVLEVRLI